MSGLDAYLPLLPLWIAAGAGWWLIAIGLIRRLDGHPRRAALVAHTMTPMAAVPLCVILGFGLLYAVIGLTVEWWALAIVTRCRPERLVAPEAGALRLLAVWALVGALGAYCAFSIVL